MQGGGNTSVPCPTDPLLWIPLCSTRSHRSLWSPASTYAQRSMKFRRQSDRPARDNPQGWTGFLQRSSSQPVQWPSKHSTHSTSASGKKRMCPKNSGMAHSSPCSKTRGSQTGCGNYRGISLLSIAGKILARAILNRLITNILEENLPEAHCGFCPNCSTTDMIFSVRQVQEKCIKQNMDLAAIFIDLTKAFDTFNIEALLVILSKLGCPTKFVNLIRQVHDDMTGQVLSDSEASEPFSISNGVKQGCVLAPVLFNLFITCMLNYATRDLEQGVCLRYRLDGSLFDLHRLTAKTKTVKKTVLEALFADDCALMAHRESDLQIIINKFAEASRLFGLATSSARQRSCFSHHLPQLPTDPPSQLMAPSWRRSMTSNTSAAWSAVTGVSTRRSAPGSARPAKLLAAWRFTSWASTTSGSSWSSRCTGCLFSPASSMVVRHGPCTGDTWSSWSISICAACGPSWQDCVSNLQVLNMAESTSIEAIVMKS